MRFETVDQNRLGNNPLAIAGCGRRSTKDCQTVCSGKYLAIRGARVTPGLERREVVEWNQISWEGEDQGHARGGGTRGPPSVAPSITA